MFIVIVCRKGDGLTVEIDYGNECIIYLYSIEEKKNKKNLIFESEF
jgi:hypothetical protein